MEFLYNFYRRLIKILYEIVNVNKVLRITIRIILFFLFYLTLQLIFNEDVDNAILTVLFVGISWFWFSKPITNFLISKFFSHLDKKNDKPLKLVRFPDKGYVGGVCHGISVYTSTSPIIWRIIAVLGISGSIWIYPALWIFLKKGEQINRE
tara:strand:+ start:619 stop:1071 length:453 start_codon:yes stop_codon:yes gene_type:complete